MGSSEAVSWPDLSSFCQIMCSDFWCIPVIAVLILRRVGLIVSIRLDNHFLCRLSYSWWSWGFVPGQEEVEHSQRHEGDPDVKGNSHRSVLLEDFLELLGLVGLSSFGFWLFFSSRRLLHVRLILYKGSKVAQSEESKGGRKTSRVKFIGVSVSRSHQHTSLWWFGQRSNKLVLPKLLFLL